MRPVKHFPPFCSYSYYIRALRWENRKSCQQCKSNVKIIDNLSNGWLPKRVLGMTKFFLLEFKNKIYINIPTLNIKWLLSVLVCTCVLWRGQWFLEKRCGRFLRKAYVKMSSLHVPKSDKQAVNVITSYRRQVVGEFFVLHNRFRVASTGPWVSKRTTGPILY